MAKNTNPPDPRIQQEQSDRLRGRGKITHALPRPWCCPEPRCAPVHQLTGGGPDLAVAEAGESFICFGGMTEPVEFVYDGVPHVNDLRSCSYTPLKGVIANQENADDWRAIANAYTRALRAIGGQP